MGREMNKENMEGNKGEKGVGGTKRGEGRREEGRKEQGRQLHINSGGLKFMLFLRIDIYQSLKRWGITLNWNECT